MPPKPNQEPDPSLDPATTTMEGLLALENAQWVRLVETYFNSIYQWCLRGGLDAHSAADVTQEVFIAALGNLNRFQRSDASTLGGWLRRICQRRIADYHRAKIKRGVGGDDAHEQMQQLTSIRQNLGDTRGVEISNQAVLSAIAKVQTEFGQSSWRAFWMTTVEERSAIDVAFDLGITRNAVYLAKSRVLKRLKCVLNSSS